MANGYGVTKNDISLLVEILRRAETDVLKAVEGQDLSTSNGKQLMLEQIRSILKGVEEKGVDFFRTSAYQEYYDGIQEEVQRAMKNAPGATPAFNLVDPNSLVGYVDQATSEFKGVLSNTYANVDRQLGVIDRKFRQEALIKTGKAILTGETRKQLSKELSSYLRQNGLTGVTFYDSNGNPKNWSLDAYTKMLARSTMRNARLAAKVQAAKDLDTDLLVFTSHPNASPMCAPWEGRIVSISGETKGYPTLEKALTWFNGRIGMMNHAWCRHDAHPYFDITVDEAKP